MSENPKYPWLGNVLGKVSLFFVFVSLLLIFFYILGNFQGFLDSTQRMLISFLEISSLIGFIIQVYRIAMFLLIAAREKKMYLARFITSILLLVFFIGTYLVLKFLETWL
jgi:hypothetical protein